MSICNCSCVSKDSLNQPENPSKSSYLKSINNPLRWGEGPITVSKYEHQPQALLSTQLQDFDTNLAISPLWGGTAVL